MVNESYQLADHGPTKNHFKQKLGKVLLFLGVSFVIAANFLVHHYLAALYSPRGYENIARWLNNSLSSDIFLYSHVVCHACIGTSVFLLAAFSALAPLTIWKRGLCLMAGIVASLMALHFGYFVVSPPQHIGQAVWNYTAWMPFIVSAIALPGLVLRAGRGHVVRIVGNNVDETSYDPEANRFRKPELVYGLGWIGLSVAFCIASVDINKADLYAMLMGYGAILFGVGAIYFLILLPLLKTKRYVAWTIRLVAILCFVIGPAIAAVVFLFEQKGNWNFNFFWYSYPLVLTQYAAGTLALLYSMVIVGVRLIGYRLHVPTRVIQPAKTQYELNAAPHPLDD